MHRINRMASKDEKKIKELLEQKKEESKALKKILNSINKQKTKTHITKPKK